MRVVVVTACAVTALMCAARAAGAAEAVGKRVAAVRLEVEGRATSDPRLLELVETKPDRPLSMSQVRDTVAHLFNLGRYEDIRVHAAAAGEGVTLRYELVPLHPVSRLTFAGLEGAPGVDQGGIRRAIVDGFGTSPPLSRTTELVRVVEDALQQRGYLRPRVTVRADITHQPERATLAFTVEAGSRARIGSIDTPGISSAARGELLRRLRLSAGAPYERDALAARVDAYIALRRSRGYYDSSLVVTPVLTDDDRVANMTMTVNEGTRARIVFAGDQAPDRPEVLVPVVREGVLDEDLLEDATLRIEEHLKALGFRDAAAPYTRTTAEGDTIVTFTIARGSEYRTERVDLTGNVGVPTAEIAPQLRLRPGTSFSTAAMEVDVSSIVELYRRRGFAGARVQSAVETLPRSPSGSGPIPVVVRLSIAEGARTVVGSVRVEGNVAVPSGALLEGLGLQSGRPFLLNQVAVGRDRIQLEYANRGFANASIEGNPGVSADRTRADVVFTVREGARITVDHVLIVGNVRISTDVIERELQLKVGDPMGLAAVAESQRRLAALGLFRRTRITSAGHGDQTRRDLVVTVEEAPVTTIGYGGGLEAGPGTVRSEGGPAVQEVQFAPRAFFEAGRRNLFGKNRSVNLFAGVSYRRKPQETGSSAYGFNEYRVLGTYREPRLWGTTADGLLTLTIEQQIRPSFNFARQAFGADVVRRLNRALSVRGNYQIQRTELVDQSTTPSGQEALDSAQRALDIDKLFPQVRLSSFSSSLVRDTRDDVLDPASGCYLSANGQVAARAVGSEVGFAKSFWTAQTFRRLPRVGQTVLAASGRLGLATGFPRFKSAVDEFGTPVEVEIRDLPASERFFAGGDTTVRGFSLDQLGSAATIDNDGLASGGNAMVILNAELRLPVRGGFGLVGFIDTGNVFARTVDIDLGQLRTSIGFGVRYRSPIGPIRVDLGFKVRRQDVAGRREDLTALHISLGQAF